MQLVVMFTVPECWPVQWYLVSIALIGDCGVLMFHALHGSDPANAGLEGVHFLEIAAGK